MQIKLQDFCPLKQSVKMAAQAKQLPVVYTDNLIQAVSKHIATILQRNMDILLPDDCTLP